MVVPRVESLRPDVAQFTSGVHTMAGEASLRDMETGESGAVVRGVGTAPEAPAKAPPTADEVAMESLRNFMAKAYSGELQNPPPPPPQEVRRGCSGIGAWGS